MNGLSVILPTYNRAAMIERALDSVHRQTVACDEIIVVDDGSTDYTYDVVSSFSRKCDIPVRYFRQKNRGPAAARNRAVREARCPLIAFLDSDDHWQKKKVEIQKKSMLENPEYLISHTQERWFRRGEHLNQKSIHRPRNGHIFDHCLKLCAVGMSTVMLRKELFEAVGMFNERLRCCEDYDFWLRCSWKLEFLLVAEALTVKEGGRDDQVSHQYRIGMDRFRIFSIADLLDREPLSPSQRELALTELRRKCSVYGKGCMKHGRSSPGKKALKLAEWAEDMLQHAGSNISVPQKLIPVPDAESW